MHTAYLQEMGSALLADFSVIFSLFQYKFMDLQQVKVLDDRVIKAYLK